MEPLTFNVFLFLLIVYLHFFQLDSEIVSFLEIFVDVTEDTFGPLSVFFNPLFNFVYLLIVVVGEDPEVGHVP